MKKSRILISGALAGIFSVLISPDYLFFFLIVYLIGLWLARHTEKDERNFILLLFLAGVLSRFIFIFIYQWLYLVILKNPDILGPDGESYIKNGWFISRIMLHKDISSSPFGWPGSWRYSYPVNVDVTSYAKDYFLPPVKSYQVGFYSYFIALLFIPFGYAPILVKSINGILGVLSGILIYYIAKKYFCRETAKATAIAVVFLPSSFILSCTGLRDSIVIFCLIASILLAIKSVSAYRLRNVIALILLLFILYLVQDKLFGIFLCAIILGFVLIRGSVFSKLTIVFAAFILFYPIFQKELWDFVHNSFYTFYRAHYGYVTTPGRNYFIYPDGLYGVPDLRGYLGVRYFISALITGSFYVFFSPFVWSIDNMKDLVWSGQMLLWYVLLGFSVYGVIILLKKKIKSSIFIFTYLLLMMFPLSLLEGNFGTLFRHRELITPFILMLGIAGLTRFLKRIGFKSD